MSRIFSAIFEPPGSRVTRYCVLSSEPIWFNTSFKTVLFPAPSGPSKLKKYYLIIISLLLLYRSFIVINIPTMFYLFKIKKDQYSVFFYWVIALVLPLILVP